MIIIFDIWLAITVLSMAVYVVAVVDIGREATRRLGGRKYKGTTPPFFALVTLILVSATPVLHGLVMATIIFDYDDTKERVVQNILDKAGADGNTP